MYKKELLRHFILGTFLFPVLSGHAQSDPRLTQLDVRHYHIQLEIGDFASDELKGSCKIKLVALQNNLQQVQLDLVALKADSVRSGNTLLTFTNPDPKEKITVQLASPLASGDSTVLEVFYSGVPKTVPSFGGFYFNNPYAFNLGVNINADPASFGRAWFPCIDHFEDKAIFDFSITADSVNHVLCNGRLISKDQPGNGKITWHWQLKEPISTYLASVAAAPYAVLEDTYVSINGDTNLITLAALPADTSKLRGSFAHLPDVIRIFEQNYGPHTFNRVGYNMVPFFGGAMEHATNIAYPAFANTGNADYETLWGHELSHHWWGDNVTCKYPSEMWLNEGWASYSEILMMEKLYGKESGKAVFQDKVYQVLRSAHLSDSGVYPVSGVPQRITYGRHVYDKGAITAHTLRAYLGDALFFNTIKHVMQTLRNKTWTTDDFRTALEDFTGKDLRAYFDHWVKAPGFVAVTAQCMKTEVSGSQFKNDVKVSQRLRWASAYFPMIPVQVQLVGKTKDTTISIELHVKDTLFTVVTDFEPYMVVADREELLADAVTAVEVKCKTLRNNSQPSALTIIRVVSNLADTALVRVAHVWTRPEEYIDGVWGVVRSANRYWIVDGDFEDGTDKINLNLNYDARKVQGSFSSGWIDTGFIYDREDSLAVLFRPKGSNDWFKYTDLTDVRGSLSDLTGLFVVNKLRKGAYILVISDGTLNLPAFTEEKKWQVYPNPATDKLYIKGMEGKYAYRIYDVQGRMLLHEENVSTAEIALSGIANGQYFLEVTDGEGRIQTDKFIVKK